MLILAIAFGKLTVALGVSFSFPRSEKRIRAFGLFVGLGYDPTVFLSTASISIVR